MTTTANRAEISFFGIAGTSSKMETPTLQFERKCPKVTGSKK
jgi:hypothetical protein